MWIPQEADVKTSLEVHDLLGEAPVNYKGKEAGVGRESFQNTIQV